MTVFTDVTFGDENLVVGSLLTEVACLRKLIDSTRHGFIEMAKENIKLHTDIDGLKDENEALQRLLKVGA